MWPAERCWCNKRHCLEQDGASWEQGASLVVGPTVRNVYRCVQKVRHYISASIVIRPDGSG